MQMLREIHRLDRSTRDEEGRQAHRLREDPQPAGRRFDRKTPKLTLREQPAKESSNCSSVSWKTECSCSDRRVTVVLTNRETKETLQLTPLAKNLKQRDLGWAGHASLIEDPYWRINLIRKYLVGTPTKVSLREVSCM
jgi:hypothetical protein